MSQRTAEQEAEDRRASERHLACVLAQVEREEGTARSAIIRDVSVTGALLFTRATLVVGERVTLSLYILGDGQPPVPATGHVVRSGPRPRALADVWTHEAAIRFDGTLDAHEERLARIAAQQAKVFGTPSQPPPG
jgi:hypothetical protein